MKIIVNKEKCPQDHRCPAMAICPKQSITQENIYALPQVNPETCILCKQCINYCPKGAFELHD